MRLDLNTSRNSRIETFEGKGRFRLQTSGQEA